LVDVSDASTTLISAFEGIHKLKLLFFSGGVRFPSIINYFFVKAFFVLLQLVGVLAFKLHFKGSICLIYQFGHLG